MFFLSFQLKIYDLNDMEVHVFTENKTLQMREFELVC